MRYHVPGTVQYITVQYSIILYKSDVENLVMTVK